MTLEDVEIMLNRRFKGRVCEASSLAPTGEPYVTVVSGGIKIESERAPVLCATEEIAVDLYAKAVLEYAATRQGVLYWRTTPEIETTALTEQEFGRPTQRVVAPRFNVYSRLLISDAPVAPVATDG